MLSTYDVHGGAAKASFNLFKELINRNGIEILMYVQNKNSNCKQVIRSGGLINFLKKTFAVSGELLLKVVFPSKIGVWQSFALWSSFDIKVVDDFKPDLVCINWIGNGFMKPEDIKQLSKYKVIWIFHDMWPILGSEHFYYGNQESSAIEKYLLKRKVQIWNKSDFLVVTPSSWLTKVVNNTGIFDKKRIKTINNGLDTSLFRPISKVMARKYLKLPMNKKVILFGAYKANSDKRKGKTYLVDAFKKIIKKCYKNKEKISLITFGYKGKGFFVEEGVEIINFGIINDERLLVKLFSAADTTVIPSMQESFGQVAAESLSCGTPVVAFNTSGLKDVVDHKKTGYLAKCYSSNDLAKGLTYILNLDNSQKDRMQIECRKVALKRFSLKKYTDSYCDLFSQILKSK